MVAISWSRQRRIGEVFADAAIDVPRRHLARACLLLHRPRPRPDLPIGHQRHRRRRAGTVALLAGALQDRQDVLGERRRRLPCAGGAPALRVHARRRPTSSETDAKRDHGLSARPLASCSCTLADVDGHTLAPSMQNLEHIGTARASVLRLRPLLTRSRTRSRTSRFTRSTTGS